MIKKLIITVFLFACLLALAWCLNDAQKNSVWNYIDIHTNSQTSGDSFEPLDPPLDLMNDVNITNETNSTNETNNCEVGMDVCV